MSMRSWRETFVLGASLTGLLACRQTSSPISPPIFTNPGEVTLICFDGSDDEGYRDNPERDPTLPLDCCDKVIGTSDEEIEARAERCGATPVAHALVTQVQRGEAAAVDLDNRRVLDSDRKVPGYTFVDVGGLPTAIVVPRATAEEAPHWTYVAGRENRSLRAIASCRFKVGRACGPELALDAETFAQETELALAGEPREMLLAQDGQGIWISLPDAGLLAYVALPTSASHELVAGVYQPFPEPVQYFPLPGGFDRKPAAAVNEMEPYRFFCRAEDTTEDPEDPSKGPVDQPDTWSRLQMPLSTPAESSRVPRPTLLRAVNASARESGGDTATPFVFVADEGQMAVHAFVRDADGALSLRASLPVGAPLRDFAVTPEVPARAPAFDALAKAWALKGEDRNRALAAAYAADGTTRRYLYAIDDRDGSLMAFVLSLAGGVPSLTPLIAPQPARNGAYRTANFADRLSLGTDGYVARALEVVDTRTRLRSDGSLDDHYCGESVEVDGEDVDGLDLGQLQRVADEAKRANDSAPSALAEAQAIAAQERVDRFEQAGGSSLHGVFLMVATTRGQLVVLDVHDTDLACRVALQCDRDAPPDNERGVALQRHRARLDGSANPTVSVSPSSELANVSCPAGYAKPDGEAQLCVSQDPWVSRGISLTVTYEGALTETIGNGLLEPDGEDRVRLKAPAGFDFCARGANAEDGLLVAILSQPDDDKISGGRCPLTTLSTPPRLRVLEARHDSLVLEQRSEDDIDLPTLLSCYREFVAFDLRLDDQYLVSSASLGVYQHNNMSAADGTCVRDETLDPRFTSRAQLGELYQNQFVAFVLRGRSGVTPAPDGDAEDAGPSEGDVDAGPIDEPDAGPSEELDAGPIEEDAGAAEDGGMAEGDAGPAEDEGPTEEEEKREISPTLAVTLATLPVATSIISASSSRTDTLPHRVRYFPENGYLFVVDQASQGLRRFFLFPEFGPDNDSNFR